MRIVMGGDRSWRCDALATAIVRRMVARYGPGIVIAHDGGPGVDQSFSLACRALGVAIDFRQCDYALMGDHRFRNREILRPGAGLCVVVCRGALDARTEDLARQAMAAGVPTYLIADDRVKPTRMRPG